MTVPMSPASSPQAEKARKEAFAILAGCIFGKNKVAECRCMHES